MLAIVSWDTLAPYRSACTCSANHVAAWRPLAVQRQIMSSKLSRAERCPRHRDRGERAIRSPRPGQLYRPALRLDRLRNVALAEFPDPPSCGNQSACQSDRVARYARPRPKTPKRTARMHALLVLGLEKYSAPPHPRDVLHRMCHPDPGLGLGGCRRLTSGARGGRGLAGGGPVVRSGPHRSAPAGRPW